MGRTGEEMNKSGRGGLPPLFVSCCFVPFGGRYSFGVSSFLPYNAPLCYSKAGNWQFWQ
jgi:hypothetical protein